MMGEHMTTKSTQWGTAIYESEGEVPLSGAASGLAGLRLKRVRIVRGIDVADLPDPWAFEAHVAARVIMGGDVAMSPEMFRDLLECVKAARPTKSASADDVSPALPRYCDDCGTDDPPDADPALATATATLIEYENRIESTNPVGGFPTLNRIFAEGWQFQCQVGPDLILLKRRKG